MDFKSNTNSTYGFQQNSNRCGGAVQSVVIRSPFINETSKKLLFSLSSRLRTDFIQKHSKLVERYFRSNSFHSGTYTTINNKQFILFSTVDSLVHDCMHISAQTFTKSAIHAHPRSFLHMVNYTVGQKNCTPLFFE